MHSHLGEMEWLCAWKCQQYHSLSLFFKRTYTYSEQQRRETLIHGRCVCAPLPYSLYARFCLCLLWGDPEGGGHLSFTNVRVACYLQSTSLRDCLQTSQRQQDPDEEGVRKACPTNVSAGGIQQFQPQTLMVSPHFLRNHRKGVAFNIQPRTKQSLK